MYLYHLINYLRYKIWFFLCCRQRLLWVIRSCHLLARWIFMPVDMHNFAKCVKSFGVSCWMSFILLPSCFVPLTFPFQFCFNCRDCLICNWVHFLFGFLFLKWSSLWILCPVIKHFIFMVLHNPYLSVEPCQVLSYSLVGMAGSCINDVWNDILFSW